MTKKGTLFGIGTGPGDPELLTVKAWRMISLASVIAYPKTVSGDALARRIVAPFMPDDITELAIDLPMCSEREPAQQAYDAAAKQIAAHLDNGEDVLFLCEGDAFFYGSFMYLADRMMPEYAIEVIPGVTSLSAAAAACKRPLAARNDVLKVLPAPLEESRLRCEIATAQSIAIIKVGKHFDKIRTLLRDMGLEAHAHIIEAASHENQKVTPLNDIAEGDKPYFSLILVYAGGELDL